MQTTLLSIAIAMILALLAALVGPHVIRWNDKLSQPVKPGDPGLQAATFI